MCLVNAVWMRPNLVLYGVSHNLDIPYIEQKDGPINCYSIQTLIGTDGVHPSSKGYKALGAWLSGEIARLIG